MPTNENPWVKELLSWHGHDRGGVHVPFQARANPFGSVIVTGLVERLRALAATIASGLETPRWIFLIGGPGNGKSETVEDFLNALDDALGTNGALRSRLTAAFNDQTLVPRRVEITTADMAGTPSSFAQHIGRLVIVQDATATDDAQGNAAKQLAHDIVDLLTTPENPPPIFVACTNRGLLSRAHKEAYIAFSGSNEATKIFGELIRSSSLGLDALKARRPTCWPLHDFPRIACWPLDQESLLTSVEIAIPAMQQVLAKATELPLWESPDRCADCDANAVCPFRQNAEWLREATNSTSLTRILRHGELATGQRWNFRDAFSLVAELMVGEWDDFESNIHPCKWVHDHAAIGGTDPSPETIRNAYHLLNRLYPHALFLKNWLQSQAQRIEAQAEHFAEQPFSKEFVQKLGHDSGNHPKPIREKLINHYSRFDPATYSPSSSVHVLYQVETQYSQSIDVGNDVPRIPALALCERRYLECLKEAEKEWDLLGRDSSVALAFVHLLRRAACILVKRSMGVRLGNHAFEAELEEFSATIRNPTKLRLLKDALQQILGKDRFRFNLVESYGQPAAEEEDKLVILDGPRPGLQTYAAPGVAPGQDQTSPSHDVPSFAIGNDMNYRIPITFDFFLALTLRAAGCANSSLPASVRAAIDRVRHRYAGELCRSKREFANGTASIVLDGTMAITLTDETSQPDINPI
jgi:hypothetical protein